MKTFTFLMACFFFLAAGNELRAGAPVSPSDRLAVGQPLPDARLNHHSRGVVRLDDLKGRVKIISIVPQLNTPVCDEQTHRFSEGLGKLSEKVDVITISTNSAGDQEQFARKASIGNILFLSDRPEFDFGRQTGLLHADFGFLRRTVLVVDGDNRIRYADFVPGGGLPRINKALMAAGALVDNP